MTDDASLSMPYTSDAGIDEVLAEFGGDRRKAIAALWRELATLGRRL